MLGDNCFIGVSIAKSPAFIGRQMPGAVPGCGKTWWVKGANRSEKKQNCFSHLRLKWKKRRLVGQVVG